MLGQEASSWPARLAESVETGTGIDSEPDTADGRADERAARAYQVLLAELFEAKHCEMCDENDCTADNPM